jgi:sugar phosphate isomerase/epimerase
MMTAAPLDRLAIHTMTTKPLSLKQCIAGYQARNVPGITVWRQALAPQGAKESAKMLADSGLDVVALVRGGFFTGKTAAERQKALDDNRLALEEATTIGAPMVVLVCGATPGQPLPESRRQILEGIQKLAPEYKARGVRLAIEPLHPMYAADRSAVLTMKHAREMCSQFPDELPGPACGRKLVGIAVDVYHVWWDETLADEIRNAGREGWLHAFHVCDWRVETRDLLNDRGLMGEGCVDIPQIRGWMEEAGFSGWIEVEIFSTERWAGDQEIWIDDILNAYRGHV